MAPELALAGWVVLAFVMQVIPSTDNHWRRAYVLIALGVPLLLWTLWLGRFGLALLAAVAMGLVLRWPVWYGLRWIGRRLRGGGR